MGSDAESASCARHRFERARDRERRCDLPRHASRWGIRAQVEARLRGGGRGFVQKMGRPVKVVWTREDDIKFDYYNAVASMYMKAALGANGKPTAWLQRSVFPPIPSIFDVNAVYGDPSHLQQGWTDIPYDLPNLRIENGPAKAHVRIGWLRSVANIYHA